MSIRVVVVDDHPAIRAGVRSLLELADDIELVGEAASGTQALQASKDLAPDVVIMDLRIPGGNGIDTTRQLSSLYPRMAVLVLTMVDDDASIFAAIRAGASGYLRKESDADEIIRAIRAVAHGEFITSPGIADRIIGFFNTPHDGLPAFAGLTAREREILDMIAGGANNQEIARRLFLSPKTVRNHIGNVFAKLQVSDRAQAIVKAREAGLGHEL